ncbi:MAG: preprotein translocase subunit SecY [Desulfurococcaceae archaeon]
MYKQRNCGGRDVMGVLDLLANVANYLPTAIKPARKPGLYERLFWTAIALVTYVVMSNTPLYGISVAQQNILLLEIIFASNAGTLMELGIGPIVTAGLIMQILVGAKLIDMDLSNPSDRKKFTAAQKTFAVLLAAFQAGMYAAGCRYWTVTPGQNPFFGCTASLTTRALTSLQLFLASYVVILLDEMIQKGWGIGSGISLFILAGVAQRIFWNIFSPVVVYGEKFGLVPHLIDVLSAGRSLSNILVRAYGADILGLVATIVVVFVVVYLQSMTIQIPASSPKLRSIKTKIPLQFLYVTNIPVLLVGILYSDLVIFANIARMFGSGWIADVMAKYDSDNRLIGGLAYYLSPPSNIYGVLADPFKALVYSTSFIVLAVLFGVLWIEVAGLNAEAQAEQLIKSGIEIPGLRRNPKILKDRLEKIIPPLTILSSIIVALIAISADIAGAYGSGMGLLLAVGIVQQYYSLITYERALEAYPLLKKLVGE